MKITKKSRVLCVAAALQHQGVQITTAAVARCLPDMDRPGDQLSILVRSGRMANDGQIEKPTETGTPWIRLYSVTDLGMTEARALARARLEGDAA